MPNVVKKGAGRPAAAAKSNKHAQRTPLPPKAGSVAEAAVEFGRTVPATERQGMIEKPMGERPVAELRAIAKALMVSGYSRMKRGDLLNAILEAERAKVTVPAKKSEADRAADAFAIAAQETDKYAAYEVGTVDEFGTVSEVSIMADGKKMISYAEEGGDDSASILAGMRDCPDCGRATDLWKNPSGSYEVILNHDTEVEHECDGTPKTPAPALPADSEGKSYGKAYAFGQAVLAAKWTYEIVPAPDGEDRAQVIARRGSTETIEIEWVSGVFQGDTCYYSHAGRNAIKLRNASHAKQYMAVPPATAAETAKKVAAHKAVRGARKTAAEATTAARKALPFSEASLDQEVLDALYGRTIAWKNSISGDVEEARVPALAEGARNDDGTPGRRKQTHAPRITEGRSGRQIEFVSGTGYRTVRLSAIISVH